jgi:hypothetical protein
MSETRRRLERIISKEADQRPPTAFCSVIGCDPQQLTVDLMMIDPINPTQGNITPGVPLPITHGVNNILPKPGDKVLVAFVGGDRNLPVVIACYPANVHQLIGQSVVPVSTMMHVANMR